MSSFVANFGRIRFTDLQAVHSYSPWLAYAQSKLADMLMGKQLADVGRGERLGSGQHDRPSRIHTDEPAVDRSEPRQGEPPPQRDQRRPDILPSQDVEHGTDPLLFAATSPVVSQGGYDGPGEKFNLVGRVTRQPLPRSARGVDLAASLWSVAEDLTGTAVPTDALVA